MKSRIAIFCGVAALFSAAPAQATDESPRPIPAKLDCGAFSTNPKANGAFTAPITLLYSKGAFSAERTLISHPGKEVFTGDISPLGRIALAGTYDGRGAWQYTFAGQLSDKRPTILVGALSVTSGAAGHRDCKITMLVKPADLIASLSLR